MSKRVIIEEWIRVRPEADPSGTPQQTSVKREEISSGLSIKPASKTPTSENVMKPPLIGLGKLPKEFQDLVADDQQQGDRSAGISPEPGEGGSQGPPQQQSLITKGLNELVVTVLKNMTKGQKKAQNDEVQSEAETEFSDEEDIATDEREDEIWNMMEKMDIDIPPDEREIVHSLLTRFSMTSEQSSAQQVDLRLTLMALPHQINETNFSRVELFNFNLVQESLIDFQHQEVVDLFQYYDNRHRARFTKIMTRVQRHNKEMYDIRKQILARQRLRKFD